MSLRPYLVVSAPSAGVSNVCEAKNVPLLVQNEEQIREMHSFERAYASDDVAYKMYNGSMQCCMYINKQYMEHLDTLWLQQFPDINPFNRP